MPQRYIQRLQIIDRLIRIKGTGTPKQLAKRLNISSSRLYTYLKLMKDNGAPIAYCKMRGSYYYELEAGFYLHFICVNVAQHELQ